MADKKIEYYISPYMGRMSQAEYNNDVKVLTNAINLGKQAYKDLKLIVSKDSNKAFANGFKYSVSSPSSEFEHTQKGNLNLFHYWYIDADKIEDGYIITDPNSSTGGDDKKGNHVFADPNKPSAKTSQDVKDLYNKKIKQIKEAVDDYVYDNGSGKNILDDNDLDAGFNNLAASKYADLTPIGGPGQDYTIDPYAMAAAGTYLWQNIFDTTGSSFLSKTTNYLGVLNEIKVYYFDVNKTQALRADLNKGYYDAKHVMRNSFLGWIAALQGCLDKLKNFNPVTHTFKSDFAKDLATGNLTEVTLGNEFDAILSRYGIQFDLVGELKRKYGTFLGDNLSTYQAGFYRVFRPNENFINKNEKYVKNIWNRIKTSGLLDLALSVNSVAEFTRARFNVGSNLTDPTKGSAAKALDPVRDTLWLNDLSIAVQQMSSDPITLSIIQAYFPNLVTFFFDALAASADYSNGSESDSINNFEDMAKSLLSSFGTNKDGEPVFTAIWETDKFLNTAARIKQALEEFPFRENIPPKTPDIFHFRLGASNFYVPPVSIDISTHFKTGSLTGGAIRQKSSPKFNAGYKETSINIKLFFPNYEEIWGISLDGIQEVKLTEDFKIDFKAVGNEEKIDKFLSSLRGLIAAFKYAPILPVKNHYLNAVHGITGVALSSMSISTIPNYPFALVVDLELLNFNHKPFLPMINDFNQAVHWGKFRHYMGKAAGNLHAYINESFFLGTSETPVEDNDYLGLPHETQGVGGSHGSGSVVGVGTLTQMDEQGYDATKGPLVYQNPIIESGGLKDPFVNDVLTTNVMTEWKNGNNISLFTPRETQTKIFSPDTSSFRSEEEKNLQDAGHSIWDGFLKKFGIVMSQASGYHRNLDSVVITSTEGSINPNARRVILESADLITAGMDKKGYNAKVYAWYAHSFVLENKTSLNQNQIDYILKDPNETTTEEFTSDITQYKYRNAKLVRLNNASGQDVNYSLKDVRTLFKKSSENTKAFLDDLALQIAKDKAATTGRSSDDYLDQAKKDIGDAFAVNVYQRFFTSGPIAQFMERFRLSRTSADPNGGRFGNGTYSFNEWEVPMQQVDLDSKSVIVNGVSVTLGNNLAKLQLQMQDEPTYQHIGGKDSYLNVSMTVFGEKELFKIRKVFEHINGLARLEHATGVIGFLGIKNIISGLAGIKYVMPLNYEVNTTPNYPHVYDVKMSFVDFDIFQQQREELSSRQQTDMIEVFGTKKNPFLRIKQLWGAFNAYPDFPLTIKDKNGDTVGSLDPDYYFRSFEMMDSDIVNNVSSQQDKVNNFIITPKSYSKEEDKNIINAIKDYVQNDKLSELKTFFEQKGIESRDGVAYVEGAIQQFFSGQKKALLTDLIKSYPDINGAIAVFGSEFKVGSNSTAINAKVGDIVSGSAADAQQVQDYLAGKSSKPTEAGMVSFSPDELSMHHMIAILPASQSSSDEKIPAVFSHANGYQLGYMSKTDNLFYITEGGVEVTNKNPDGSTSSSKNHKMITIPHSDTDNPANSFESSGTKTHTGNVGSNPARYNQPYSSGHSGEAETMSNKVPDTTRHWEKMLVDTQYRDLSGRMIRAFPTYMLWLIDEGGYYAGVKLFDNFYGLQSIIDFSIVQSEDILGDTLMLRVSNMYSKLSRPETSKIFNVQDGYDSGAITNAIDSLPGVLDTVLNRFRNMMAHMESKYVVDIKNIRLKPGVRVHLRAGYGSNPNSLQTVFNGTITQVENGEIVTITAQSDAIELSPIVNGVNKKGDSGKIDGGINTGFWLSEPRDLMVRLLSMGSSRTREAIAHATRGTIFSENKFGIRHFGSILYQPLNDREQAANDAMINSLRSAFEYIGQSSGDGLGGALSIMGSGAKGIFGIINENGAGTGPETRIPAIPLMQTLWTNFSSQRDFEIFKRNIYPGNGTGIAQFLGGDLGDGWATMASLTPEDQPNERLNYIGKVTDRAWEGLATQYGQGMTDAKSVMDAVNDPNALRNSDGSAEIIKNIAGGAFVAAGLGVASLGAPIIGGGIIGGGLTGVLNGRGGAHIFNALGITSGLDDDLPGLDEVSFRAQTYMKSVWDLFQVCARLLPNYIVAIRPFEDRSTIFYGKPHWLYTSGVVPITTGYPSDKRAQALGIDYPKPVDPDTILMETMTKLNQVTNPFADANAYSESKKPIASAQQLVSGNLVEGNKYNIYGPTNSPDSSKNLYGKIIAFGAKQHMERLNEKKKIIAKLPTSAGYATVGFHLPITDGVATESDDYNQQLKKHQQIDQLPYRYRFPFFTDRKDNILLEDYAYYSLSSELGKWSGHKADYMSLTLDRWELNGVGGAKEPTSWTKLLKEENTFSSSAKTVDVGNGSPANEMSIPIYFNQQLNFASAGPSSTVISADDYLFSFKKSSGSSNIIRMPYPDKTTSDITQFAAEYTLVQSQLSAGKTEDANTASLKEWGAPKTSEEEMFYIAMRWPYNSENGSTDELLKQHNINESFGESVDDYKNRKVLVYSPTTGKAVVCKPTYFLWGEETVGVLNSGASEKDGITGWDPTVYTDTAAGIVTGDRVGGTNSSGFLASRGNNLGLEYRARLDAVVSPDAAYFLGMMSLSSGEQDYWGVGQNSKSDSEWGSGTEDAIKGLAKAGIAPYPIPRECYYAFVPDSIPLGVVNYLTSPAGEFKLDSSSSAEKLIGFGYFQGKSGRFAKTSPLSTDYYAEINTAKTEILSIAEMAAKASLGGNVLGGTTGKDYFELVKTGDYEGISKKALYDVLDSEVGTTGSEKTAAGRNRFTSIYTEADMIAVESRKLYDEEFDSQVHVIAGNGRTLQQASDIWDQFRMGYHEYVSVKDSFQKIYGLDPDDETPLAELGAIGKSISTGFGTHASVPSSAAEVRRLNEALSPDAYERAAATYRSNKDNGPFQKFGKSGTLGTASDEFTSVFGTEFLNSESIPQADAARGLTGISGDRVRQGIELSRVNFIDANKENSGLIDYFNTLTMQKITGITDIIGQGLKDSGKEDAQINDFLKYIESPKQLFLTMVGAFRAALWINPYSRAWLVLKPNRKLSGSDQWDFGPVLKAFQAYIDPTEDFAKKKEKFLKFLAQNASEGSGATNFMQAMGQDVGGFWDRNIGPLFTALGDSLSGLMNLYRMSMMQLGYGLSQVGQMSKQANILNKALNDSIYYTLGRPGSLLRAVDNPFTREYGEPVVEIREPFQRVHYLSSFSHIISNGIQENISGVATQVTAVSDGKYPVTVAMDKSTPAERQVEKTVETGIYYDNATGSGLFGGLQPILHPFEFARGISKVAQGTPDELLAKRVALSHLKESLKDIYSGEILVIGNADIRPHDLVYLADVYERMYGLFEVEQVVHHFTSDLGFVTSITPNALVTVNDPSKWFMSSWLGSWMHMQALRNDTRLYMNSLGSGVTASGQVSVDGLSSSLDAQMIGSIQYTQGSTALAKDVMAHYSSIGYNDIKDQVKAQVAQNGLNGQVSVAGIGSMFAGATGLGAAAFAIGAMAIPGLALTSIVGAGVIGLGGSVGGNLAWKGWSWIRDNVLDQHGCYIQYLNRNGQPMDAGLSQAGQGMVVGRYATKKLLPGILGVRTKVKTDQGFDYIRTDDLLKNLGWKEKQITDLTRYISLENAVVNTQLLKFAGSGPEKAGLNQFFKIICKVDSITDGDTIEVIDIFDTKVDATTGKPKTITVRFSGINTPELNVVKADIASNPTSNVKMKSVSVLDKQITIKTEVVNYNVNDNVIIQFTDKSIADLSIKISSINTTAKSFTGTTYLNNIVERNIEGNVNIYSSEIQIINPKSAGGAATLFTQKALKGKIIILRVSPDSKKVTAIFTDKDFDSGSTKNKASANNYDKDVYGRIIGTIFYKAPNNIVDAIVTRATALFTSNLNTSEADMTSAPDLSALNNPAVGKNVLANTFNNEVFVTRFNEMLKYIQGVNKTNYLTQVNNPGLSGMSAKRKKLYSDYVYMKILEFIYDKVSDWPNIEWDEYYDDGTPATLNYELVLKGLANVDTKGLLIEKPSVITANEMAAIPRAVTVNPSY